MYGEFDYTAPVTAWWLPAHEYVCHHGKPVTKLRSLWLTAPRPASTMKFQRICGYPHASDLEHFTQLRWPA